jgi:hypothetical protein
MPDDEVRVNTSDPKGKQSAVAITAVVQEEELGMTIAKEDQKASNK